MKTLQPKKSVSKAPSYCGLSQEQFDKFNRACWSTYHYIGSDLAQCEMDCEGESGRSQEAQIDCICDADYIRNHMDATEYDTVIRPMFDKFFGKPEFMKMMKQVFPHKRYE